MGLLMLGQCLLLDTMLLDVQFLPIFHVITKRNLNSSITAFAFKTLNAERPIYIILMNEWISNINIKSKIVIVYISSNN